VRPPRSNGRKIPWTCCTSVGSLVFLPSVKEPLGPIVLSMATSTKFLGTARLSSRHVPEAATTEHVGEQVAGVAEQALLGLWHLPRVDAGDTCTHHRHASISLLVAILPQKSLTNSVARHAGNYSLLNGTSCETTQRRMRGGRARCLWAWRAVRQRWMRSWPMPRASRDEAEQWNTMTGQKQCGRRERDRTAIYPTNFFHHQNYIYLYYFYKISIWLCKSPLQNTTMNYNIDENWSGQLSSVHRKPVGYNSKNSKFEKMKNKNRKNRMKNRAINKKTG
jgi:hypothetical protein